MTSIMLVSIEYQRLGQFFKNNLSNLFIQARNLIFRCSKLHLKIRLFLIAPAIILLRDKGKTYKTVLDYS